MNAELVEFARQALSRGTPRSEIRDVLLRAGWTSTDSDKALALFADVEFAIPVPRPKPQLEAKEAFTYGVQFLALYDSAFSLGALLFNFIERALPDGLNTWEQTRLGDEIRWNVASLIIAFPLFLFAYWHNNRAIARDPTKRKSKPRRGLTYLTLFVATICLVGDLVELVYSALGGELTERFVLKVLVVAVIAGGTFGFFLWDMRKDEEET
ncbi:MAG TPA: DUF5671 domain-containing protein [Stellaceae bacterium]|nr:DUF5671 domain-containing protein [Stellaceae bacterium]